MKKCSKCTNIKPRKDFTRDTQKADGLSYYCRSCVREQRLEKKRRLDKRCADCNTLIDWSRTFCHKCKFLGERSPRWKGGRRINTQGYIVLNGYRGHPNAIDGQIREHVLVMSTHLDRPLQAHENVHHKNGNKIDNRLENLELWNTRQPSGQRVEDKVQYALEILRLYRPDLGV